MAATITHAELAKHGASLRRLARRLAEPELAEDLVQETYVAALEQGGAARAPDRWLRGVLRNRAKMARRSEGRRRAREAQEVAPSGELDPETLSTRAEAYRIVLERVEALDEPFRSTIFLHFFDGLSLAEIARRGDTPAGTVRWRLKTGLDRLRTELDQQYGQRELWCLALLPPPALAPTPPSLVAKVAAMKLSTKILLTVPLFACGSVLVGVGVDDDDAEQDTVEASDATPVATASPEPAPAPAPPAPAPSTPASNKAPAPSPQATHRFEDLQARKDRLRAMERARAQRAKQHPGEDPLPEIEPMDYFGHVDDQIDQDIVRFAQDCRATVDEKVAGRLVLRFHVTLEPEIGGVIEEVEANSTPDQPEVEECVRESAYMLDLPPYPEPGRLTFAIQLELEPG
jgi:RNA polymerase sigma-70 factor (ECF subfamily)